MPATADVKEKVGRRPEGLIGANPSEADKQRLNIRLWEVSLYGGQKYGSHGPVKVYANSGSDAFGAAIRHFGLEKVQSHINPKIDLLDDAH